MPKSSSTKVSKLNVALKVALVNTLSIGGVIFFLPLFIFKLKYGEFSLGNNQIKEVAGGMDVRRGHAGGGFKEAVNGTNKNAYCNQPHPVIGWIDICNGNGFWGFSQTTNKQKTANTYRVLLIGGSVANYMGKSLSFHDGLTRRMERLKDPRRLEIFNAAVPGFKQPQQLAVLNALIASGWKFDAVVNVSGNNEIAFVANHNFHEGYNPLLPYAHPERSLMAAKMLYRPQDECDKEGSLSWHPILQYIKILCYRNSLDGMKAYVHFQPYLAAMRYKEDIPSTQNEALDRALQVWLASTRSTYAVATANGMNYLEVIQPSQYLDGSKTFSKEEKELARSDKSMRVVGMGYSRINIRDFGIDRINILDARLAFANTPDTVYIDSCCHLNKKGESIVVDMIAQRLLPTK